MAITATRLDEFRLAYEQSNLDAWEHRLGNYGALATYQKDTANLIPGYSGLIAERTAEVRTLSIPVLNRKDFTTGTSRTCTAATHEITSAYVTPTWTTKTFGFNLRKAEHYNNYISYQAAFNNKMKNGIRTVLEELDTAAYTNINTNVSPYSLASGNPFTFASSTFAVPNADIEEFINELSAIFMQDDFPSDAVNVVSSPRVSALVAKVANQGQANSTNLVFQLGGYSFAYSPRVTVSAGDRDTVFAAPPMSLAFLTDVDEDAKHNHVSSDGKEWSVEYLPQLGFDVGVLYQSTCADGSTHIGTGGEASLSESWLFSFDYAFATTYNSATSTEPGAIKKLALSKT